MAKKQPDREDFSQADMADMLRYHGNCCADCGRGFTRRRPGRWSRDPKRWMGLWPTFHRDAGRSNNQSGVVLCVHCHHCIRHDRVVPECQDCHGQKRVSRLRTNAQLRDQERRRQALLK
jgi:hypothetical protein